MGKECFEEETGDILKNIQESLYIIMTQKCCYAFKWRGGDKAA